MTPTSSAAANRAFADLRLVLDLESPDGAAGYRFRTGIERADGRLTGRVYTITATATAASGNTATATGEVSVPHSKGKGKGKG